jgi:hypothetical protein
VVMDSLARDFLYAGSVVGILGILTLTILQLMLVGRQRKSLFTFLSVLFVPSNELSDIERLTKKIGIYLSLAGSVTVLISGFALWAFT